MKIAFVVDSFPTISETFVIDQVAELLDRGIDVEVFSFHQNPETHISHRYFKHRMSERTHYLEVPTGRFKRIMAALPISLRLLRDRPLTLLRALNILRFGRMALSLGLLHQVSHFIGRSFDVFHCHFGTVAEAFLDLREILGSRTPLVTTLYGSDVSRAFKESPADFYDRLKAESALFFVMSEDMRRRVLAHGFPEGKVKVHPVSIDVASYPFKERKPEACQPVQLAAVGRFIEKKGFDDLIRALALVRRRTSTPFHCTLIGGGELEPVLRSLVVAQGLEEAIQFAGYLPVEKVVEALLERHLLVAPSKTAANGDME